MWLYGSSFSSPSTCGRARASGGAGRDVRAVPHHLFAGGVDHQPGGLGDGLGVDGGHLRPRLEAGDRAPSLLRRAARCQRPSGAAARRGGGRLGTCRVRVVVDDRCLALNLGALVRQHRRLLLRRGGGGAGGQLRGDRRRSHRAGVWAAQGGRGRDRGREPEPEEGSGGAGRSAAR